MPSKTWTKLQSTLFGFQQLKADLDATGLAIADQRDRDEAVGEAGRLSGRQVLAPLSSDWPVGLRLAKMV